MKITAKELLEALDRCATAALITERDADERVRMFVAMLSGSMEDTDTALANKIFSLLKDKG